MWSESHNLFPFLPAQASNVFTHLPDAYLGGSAATDAILEKSTQGATDFDFFNFRKEGLSHEAWMALARGDKQQFDVHYFNRIWTGKSGHDYLISKGTQNNIQVEVSWQSFG